MGTESVNQWSLLLEDEFITPASTHTCNFQISGQFLSQFILCLAACLADAEEAPKVILTMVEIVVIKIACRTQFQAP